MGNQCAGRRDKVDKAGRYSRHLISKYKEDMGAKYADWKDEAREQYEEAKFQYKLKKSRTTGSSYFRQVSYEGGSTKFQEILVQFEKQFPLNYLDIHEFDRRVKKLVY